MLERVVLAPTASKNRKQKVHIGQNQNFTALLYRLFTGRTGHALLDAAVGWVEK